MPGIVGRVPRVSTDQLAARRQQILDGARGCFARHGYEGATVRRLEQSTGLSRGAIFHHFRDKESLFLALAEQDAQRMADVVAAQGLVQVMRELLSSPQPLDTDWTGTLPRGRPPRPHRPRTSAPAGARTPRRSPRPPSSASPARPRPAPCATTSRCPCWPATWSWCSKAWCRSSPWACPPTTWSACSTWWRARSGGGDRPAVPRSSRRRRHNAHLRSRSRASTLRVSSATVGTSSRSPPDPGPTRAVRQRGA